MSMMITALPAPVLPPRSESWRVDPPRPRFRHAWEASFGPATAEAPVFVGRRSVSGSAFLAQELAQSAEPEEPPSPERAVACYDRMERSDDPVLAGDWVLFRRSF